MRDIGQSEEYEKPARPSSTIRGTMLSAKRQPLLFHTQRAPQRSILVSLHPTLLKNALEQTGWQGHAIDGDSWIDALHDRVASLDWGAAERDVRPFLEPGPAAESFGRESLLNVIEARRK